jgi:hypothetical protein
MSDVPLLQHIERRIDDTDRRVTERFDVLDRVLALKDSHSRSEHEKLLVAVQALQNAKANLDGRMLVLAFGASAVSAVVTAVVVFAITRGWKP